MAKNSKIEWTDHTFNHVRGCTKVSDGCKNCYAETLSARNPKVLGIWGPKGDRVIAAESYWQEPVRWNQAAQAEGVRRRVFCASLADWLEGPETMPKASHQPVLAARLRLLRLIMDTPHLDWLLLTKRPENWEPLMAKALDQAWGLPQVESPFATWLENWLTGKTPPANVWIGTSVENQETANTRIPHLKGIPAVVRFLSCEPLLGLVDVRPWMQAWQTIPPRHVVKVREEPAVNWVIVGGESGTDARPMHPDWARRLRDDCVRAEVPFFFKQWGEWRPTQGDEGRLPENWPKVKHVGPPLHVFADADTREDGLDTCVIRVGKHAAGALLDGQEWKQFPTPEVAHAA